MQPIYELEFGTRTFVNVTMYFKQVMGFGITTLEVKTLTIQIKPYAQYEKGIYLSWKAKGQQQERSCIIGGHQLFFILLNTKDAIPKVETFLPGTIDERGTMIRKGRYSSCDPRWITDMIDDVERAGITPLMLVNELAKKN